MKIRPGRVAAIARHDLRLLLTDPAFLIVMTVSPIGFMAFSERSFGLALQLEHPGQGLSGASFVVPGAAVLFSGFMVGNIGFWIFREHGWGTWERLRAADLTSTELMLGKALVPILTLAIQLTVLLGGGALLFDMHLRGSLIAFILVAACLAFVEVALGFLLLSVCKSVMQLNAITNAGTLVLGGLGGAMAPHELLPGWAQAISPITPAYWAMRGFRAITERPGGLADVALPCAVLIGFGIVCTVITVVRFEVESTKVSWA